MKKFIALFAVCLIAGPACTKKTGDTAALTATGLVNSATVALNSTADSANELEAGSAVTVFAGEVATSPTTTRARRTRRSPR